MRTVNIQQLRNFTVVLYRAVSTIRKIDYKSPDFRSYALRNLTLYVNTNFNIKMYPVMMTLNFMKNPKDVSISDIYKRKIR